MKNNGTLYIVATPIGNLGDITLRAIETLKNADLVLCEDTRVTQKILNHFEIKTKTLSYHEHSDEKKIKEIKSLLEEGKNLALVTDAGTPGISDPGNYLINQLITSQKVNNVVREVPLGDPSEGESRSIKIIPIPGPSALTAALSISGFATDKFIFLGFPPHKKKRKQFFQEVGGSNYTVCFYESSHRIKKCLADLAEVLDNSRQICLGRELTKKFETIYRGTILEIIKMDISEKGEFVVVVSKS